MDLSVKKYSHSTMKIRSRSNAIQNTNMVDLSMIVDLKFFLREPITVHASYIGEFIAMTMGHSDSLKS